MNQSRQPVKMFDGCVWVTENGFQTMTPPVVRPREHEPLLHQLRARRFRPAVDLHGTQPPWLEGQQVQTARMEHPAIGVKTTAQIPTAIQTRLQHRLEAAFAQLSQTKPEFQNFRRPCSLYTGLTSVVVTGSSAAPGAR